MGRLHIATLQQAAAAAAACRPHHHTAAAAAAAAAAGAAAAARRPPSTLGVEGGGGADLSNIIPLISMCSATAGPGGVQEQQAGGREGHRGPAVPAEQLVDKRRWT